MRQVRPVAYAEVNWNQIESWHPRPEPFYTSAVRRRRRIPAHKIHGHMLARRVTVFRSVVLLRAGRSNRQKPFAPRTSASRWSSSRAGRSCASPRTSASQRLAKQSEIEQLHRVTPVRSTSRTGSFVWARQARARFEEPYEPVLDDPYPRHRLQHSAILSDSRNRPRRPHRARRAPSSRIAQQRSRPCRGIARWRRLTGRSSLQQLR